MGTMRSRREVLAALAGAPAVAIARASYKPSLAVQTYVWTQVLRGQKRTLAEGVDEVVGSSKRAGYRQIEFVPEFVSPGVKKATAEALKKHDMKAAIVYVNGAMWDTESAEKAIANALVVAESAKKVGARIIVANMLPKPKDERKSDEELRFQSQSVNRLGEDLKSRGQRLILHHHHAEMAENAREWRELMTNTDPKLVGACIDYDWVVQGGQDPNVILPFTGNRIESFHLRNAHQGVWTESLDEGDYDYPATAAFLRDMGFRGYLVVELAHKSGMKITRPLEENLRRSRIYVEKVFGVR